MPAPRGPGRYKAIRATTCLYSRGFMFLMVAVMPPDSTWKTPAVWPEPMSSKILGSSKGISASLMSMPQVALMFFLALEITVSVRRPRKSILSRPMSATMWPSYWVISTPPLVSSFVGTCSLTGSRQMRTAQACTPSPRVRPSMASAVSMTCFASGSSL